MKKALIVNADESMRNLLVKFLNREGFEIAVATSGKEMLEKISQDRFDIVIIDENIYKQNQFDVKSVINDLMPKAKVIYISPFYAVSEILEIESDGFVRYGEKLFRISELRNLINTLRA